jgi:hypothetical protein
VRTKGSASSKVSPYFRSRHAIAVRPDDVKLVTLARADTRHEQLPHAGGSAYSHGTTSGVPGIEIADNCDPPCIGRPYDEANARNSVDRLDLCAKRLGEAETPSFVEQMQVQIAEQQTECIGILGFLHGCCRPVD